MVGKMEKKTRDFLYWIECNRPNMVVGVIENSWYLPEDKSCGFISTKNS